MWTHKHTNMPTYKDAYGHTCTHALIQTHRPATAPMMTLALGEQTVQPAVMATSPLNIPFKAPAIICTEVCFSTFFAFSSSSFASRGSSTSDKVDDLHAYRYVGVTTSYLCICAWVHARGYKVLKYIRLCAYRHGYTLTYKQMRVHTQVRANIDKHTIWHEHIDTDS